MDALEHLRLDITGFAHNLRPQAEVLVIGAGGGRDVLTALAYRQRSVRAVEVNPNTVAAVNQVFGDFTGHLDRAPNVAFVVGEGRSYLATTRDRFDIIQASFIDTVAATAAGAYAFVENGLYTVEAWKLFLSRLKPRGILTFSRFYYGSTTVPVEIYRTMALAAAALKSSGAADPAAHILLVANKDAQVKEAVATILLSPSPFSAEDIARAREACLRLRCEIYFSKDESKDAFFNEIVGKTPPVGLDRFPLDISPPTDDRPFFFFQLKMSDILSGKKWRAYGGSAFNLPALQTLVTLAAVTMVLGLALVAFPRFWLAARGRWPSRPGLPLAPLYFAAIGAAFMFVEIGFIQRLSLFLGDPTYGFTVVLLGILASSGLGSLAGGLLVDRLRPSLRSIVPWGLILALLGAEKASSFLLAARMGEGTPSRVALSVLLIFLPAFLMGMPFPLGMAAAQRADDQRASWYWAINGASAVIASVLAMVCSLTLGIRATILAGGLLYAAAALIYRGIALHDA